MIILSLFVAFLFGSDVGKKGGCPPEITDEFDPQLLEYYQRHTKNESDVVFENALLIGALSTKNLTAGVYIAPLTTTPFALYCGYFFKQSAIPSYHRYMMHFSFLKHAFDALLLATYGNNRCGIEAESELLKARSSIIKWFSDAFGVVPEISDENVTYTRTGVTAKFVNSTAKVIFGDYFTDGGNLETEMPTLNEAESITNSTNGIAGTTDEKTYDSDLILWKNLSYTVNYNMLERLIAYVSGLGWIPKTK
ncbi:ABC transporter sub-family G-like protein 17, partial [Dinothrombium tinctorium]